MRSVRSRCRCSRRNTILHRRAHVACAPSTKCNSRHNARISLGHPPEANPDLRPAGCEKRYPALMLMELAFEIVPFAMTAEPSTDPRRLTRVFHFLLREAAECGGAPLTRLSARCMP